MRDAGCIEVRLRVISGVARLTFRLQQWLDLPRIADSLRLRNRKRRSCDRWLSRRRTRRRALALSLLERDRSKAVLIYRDSPAVSRYDDPPRRCDCADDGER